MPNSVLYYSSKQGKLKKTLGHTYYVQDRRNWGCHRSIGTPNVWPWWRKTSSAPSNVWPFDVPALVMIRYLITDLPGRKESESSPVNHVEPYRDRNRLSTAGTVIQKREFRSENIQFQVDEDDKNVPLCLILGKHTGNPLETCCCGFLVKKRHNQHSLPKFSIIALLAENIWMG